MTIRNQSRLRNFTRLALALIVLASGTSALVLSHAVKNMVSPPRRPLNDHHREWMNHPHEHGVRIVSTTCLAGKVPCLLVEPDAAAGPGERGRLIREQLTTMGSPPPAYGAILGNLVLLHGRGARKEDFILVAERFCAAGFRCLVPDLPSHGDSPLRVTRYGSGALEKSLPAGVLADLARQYGFAAEPAGLWGLSMGGAYAMGAASQEPERWDSVVVVSSFDDLESVVEEQCRRRAGQFGSLLATAAGYLGAIHGGALPRDVRPVDWAAEIESPIMIAHGDADGFLKPQRGRNLFDACASDRKRWVPVAGAGHGSVLTTPMPLYATMASWFMESMPERERAARILR